MERNWLTTLKAKEAEAAASSKAPTPTQPGDASNAQSPTLLLSPDTKYCAVGIPLGELHPNEYPISSDWDKDLREEEERKDQDKSEDNFSVCFNLDADIEEQERKNKELKDQKDNHRKTPKQAQIFIS